MAGLGLLVAGVAHEVNSPAAAIQGAVDELAENVQRLARRARELSDVQLPPEDRMRFFALVEQLAPRLAGARVEAPAHVRRQARELATNLAQLGVPNAESACRTLVEIGAAEAAYRPGAAGAGAGRGRCRRRDRERQVARSAHRLFEQYAYCFATRTRFARDPPHHAHRRCVEGLLASRSRRSVSAADLHEGIENTLVLLHHELKYRITSNGDYAVTGVPVYVDELNQVWTNLIQNAQQALGGKGDDRDRDARRRARTSR